MSDSLQVFLLSFLGSTIAFSIVVLAIKAIAVEIAHREYGPPRIIVGKPNCATPPESPKIDRNVDLNDRIPIRPSPCEQVYAGNMLDALKGKKHFSVDQKGRLEEK